ncbi:MAG: hypothetical protein ACI89X_001213 [Planctomycetota bacterium]|jgi:hypothetical protein
MFLQQDIQSLLNTHGRLSVEDMFAVGFLIAAAGVVIAIFVPWLKRRDARAKQRLDLLGESLESPQLDPGTRNQILSVLAKEHEAKLGFLSNRAFWQRMFFGGGWLMFIVCSGMAALSWSGVVDHKVASEALVGALTGLAVASLPFAMREMTTRQVAKQ